MLFHTPLKGAEGAKRNWAWPSVPPSKNFLWPGDPPSKKISDLDHPKPPGFRVVSTPLPPRRLGCYPSRTSWTSDTYVIHHSYLVMWWSRAYFPHPHSNIIKFGRVHLNSFQGLYELDVQFLIHTLTRAKSSQSIWRIFNILNPNSPARGHVSAAPFFLPDERREIWQGLTQPANLNSNL